MLKVQWEVTWYHIKPSLADGNALKSGAKRAKGESELWHRRTKCGSHTWWADRCSEYNDVRILNTKLKNMLVHSSGVHGCMLEIANQRALEVCSRRKMQPLKTWSCHIMKELCSVLVRYLNGAESDSPRCYAQIMDHNCEALRSELDEQQEASSRVTATWIAEQHKHVVIIKDSERNHFIFNDRWWSTDVEYDIFLALLLETVCG